MKYPLSILSLSLLTLIACVDTTGLSADSSKTIHPQSNANASASVVEYADFQCPACAGAYAQIEKPLLAQSGSFIRFEFRQFPLSSMHQYAIATAEASECAADQGKFWEFVDIVYTNQDKLSNPMLETWGQTLGLDMPLFNRCRASHIKRAIVDAEYKQGGEMGVNGTPTFFVNGKRVESSLDAIWKAVKAESGSMGMKL
jgi:protein-disulfide isomerase